MVPFVHFGERQEGGDGGGGDAGRHPSKKHSAKRERAYKDPNPPLLALLAQ